MTPAMVELLKLSLGLAFSLARTNGATEAEIDALYQTSKDEFTKNHPSLLEDI